MNQIRSITSPGPTVFFLLRNLKRIRWDLLKLLRELQAHYGDAIAINLGVSKVFIFNHPDYFEHVLRKNWQNYPKSKRYHLFHPTVGQGLLLAEGKVWAHKRRVAQPAFLPPKVAGFAPAIVRQAEAMLKSWDGVREIDTQREMLKLLFKVASFSLFGADLSEADALSFHTNLMKVMRELEARALSPLPFLYSLPTPRWFRFRRDLKELDRIVYAIIDQRGGRIPEERDLLALLMEPKTEDGKPELNRRQLRDEVMSLLIGGYETSTNILTWTLFELARNPELQEELHKEIASAFPPGTEVTWEAVKPLKFLDAVMAETMRRYPPIWMTTRQALADDVVGEVRVPKGSLVALPFYTIHHHPRYWKNPETYDPSRFLNGSREAIPKYVFIPFSAGPRECIGKNFALMDIPVILACVLRSFAVRPLPGPDPKPSTTMTFRPSAKIRLELVRR